MKVAISELAIALIISTIEIFNAFKAIINHFLWITVKSSNDFFSWLKGFFRSLKSNS